MAIRLVVFDVAGTTIRDGGGAVRQAMHDALAVRGLTLREGAMEGIAGMAKGHAIRTLIEGHGRDELLSEVDAIHADFTGRMIRYYRDSPAVAPVDGARESFDALRAAGTQVALGTGFSREILDVVLARVGWAGDGAPIDAAIASDEVPRGRPWPDMIDALRLRLGGIPYGEVAKVGDTPVDLHEGTMARCGFVVGVLSGAHTRESLGQHPNDALIDSVAELPRLMQAKGLMPVS
ncbi:MAG TPA: HAD family hydrolase [Gemmatimonadales bacterium]|jgi:phosphonatase-like hydrolase